MRNTNITAGQELTSEDPVWHFLGDLSLCEFVSARDTRDDLMARLLFQTVRELGIPPECVENIEVTLTGFAQEAWAQFKHGRAGLPERIRVFCRKKSTAEANSTKTSLPSDAGPAMERAPVLPDPGAPMNGGWGYFLVERGGNPSAGASVIPWNAIDLYLYKEGE